MFEANMIKQEAVCAQKEVLKHIIWGAVPLNGNVCE